MLTHPDAESETLTQTIHAITVGHGPRIGQRVHAALTVRPGWQEQPVDLSATLFPVMHALAAVGISSYLGGSIASSIHGMQQSASDIDLVLLPQGHETRPVGPALISLQDDYLVEPELVAQGLREGTFCSLIHVGTLMKIDLIFPHTPSFDEAMQARVVPMLIDERFQPFPLASALEMIVWKLTRCANELASSTDGIINDAEWNDVLGMLKIQGTTLDLAQLTFWTQVMHAGYLLPQALDDAGLFPDEETFPHRLAG